MSEELKPCPFCGEKIEPPKSRQASTDRSEGFVAFAACYCGGYSATAHKMGRGNTEAEAIQEVIALWNRRAQPAEAEGVEVPVVATLLIDEVFHGSNGPETGDWDIEQNPGVTEKLAQQFPGEAFDLVRQVDHLAALSAVTAERDRLRDQVKPLQSDANSWQSGYDKGRHDGTKHRHSEVGQLRAEVEALRKDAVRWRYVRLQGDDTHWLNLLRVDLDEFGGNINAAVDALIDGEAPAMSAKEA